jgi:hypothetical protein
MKHNPEVKTMQKVFVMYRLKPGVKIEDYRKWSVTLDQKVTPFQPGCRRFEVYEIKGAEQGQSPYRIVEDIDGESWEAWRKVVRSEAMKEVVAAWNDYGDASTLKVIYGSRIT